MSAANESLRPLVIYHSGCMDGAAAALAAHYRYGDEAIYRAARYGDAPPTLDEVRGRKVWILDFSFPRAALTALAEVCDLRVLDHHKTAAEDLADLPFATFDMKHSGAMLAAFEFLPEHKRILELWRYVEDRDLWKWELPDSRAVSAALAATGALRDFRRLLPIAMRWGEEERFRLIERGNAILAANFETILAAADAAVPVTIDGFRALAVNSTVLHSEIGEELARRAPDRIGIVYRHDPQNNVFRVSLYSRGDMAPDVSTIAKVRGGGGHPRAAGYEVVSDDNNLYWIVDP